MFKVPKLLKSLDYYRSWDVYEKKLEIYDKVGNYFGEYIKDWVTDKTMNPLEIPLVVDLIDNHVKFFEKCLGIYELLLGKDNLLSYLKELKGMKQPDQIFQKIKSLDYERYVYRELKKHYKSIKKINFIGDWETQDKIVSVKSKLDLDLNYQILKNLLKAFFYIEEYCIIRKYVKITLKDIKNFNYSFRKNVLEYLRNNLITILKENDKIKSQLPQIGDFGKNNFNNLIISNDSFMDNNNVKTISITCTDSSEQISKITLEFKEAPYEYCHIDFDTNTYWIDVENFNEKNILSTIINFKREFDNKFATWCNKKLFEGWIALSIHPQDERYFLNTLNEFELKLNEITNDLNYKMYLFIKPQMGFYLNSILLEFPQKQNK